MGVEIERKFLVDTAKLPEPEASFDVEQAYLDHDKIKARVRITGEHAFLTLKAVGNGLTRAEFEYPIPVEDARELLRSFAPAARIEKTRRHYQYGGRLWEVDVFGGANTGLVIAEVELASEDEPFDAPPWVDREVSGDPRFFNAHLAEYPYPEWKDD
jgi:adenylate cyclase